ncbi:MAG: hypothetical protein U9P61_02000 [Patescibacteria group bacterium]|nr:hypothetical protein [Patescibacteria group bacterium]
MSRSKLNIRQKMKKMKEKMKDIEKRKRVKRKGVPYTFFRSVSDRK